MVVVVILTLSMLEVTMTSQQPVSKHTAYLPKVSVVAVEMVVSASPAAAPEPAPVV